MNTTLEGNHSVESQNAEKLSITLPAEMVRLIRDKVATGAYGSNSEVIRDALRAWLERDRRLAALDTAIATGLADAEAGRLHSVASVRAELKTPLRKKSPTSA